MTPHGKLERSARVAADVVVLVPCRKVERSARGRRLGEQSPCWKHPDAVVAKARELHATGLRGTDVAKALGIPYPTVRDWLRAPTRAGRPTGRPAPTHTYFVPIET